MSNGALTINASIANIQTWQSYNKLSDADKKVSTFGVRGNRFILVTKSDPLLTRIWNAILKFLHIIHSDKSSIKSLNDRSVKVLQTEPGKSLLLTLFNTSGLENAAVDQAKAELGETIKKLQEDNDTLSLHVAADQLQKAKGQPNQADLEKLQKENADQKDQIAKLQSENSLNAVIEKEKSKALQETEAQINDLKAMLKGLQANDNSSKGGPIEILNNELMALQNKYEVLFAEHTSKVQEDKNILESTKASLAAAFESQKAGLEKIMEQLKEGAEQKIAAFEEEKNKLLAAHEQEKQKLQSGSESDKAALQEKLAVLQKEKDKAEALLGSALNESQAALAALNAEHDSLSKAVEAKHSLHKNEIDALDKQLKAKIDELSKATSQHQEIKTSLESKVQEQTGFFEMLKEKSEGELSELKQHIEKLKEEIVSKETAHKKQLEETNDKLQAALAQAAPSNLEDVVQEVKATLITLESEIIAEKNKMAQNLQSIEKQKEATHRDLSQIVTFLKRLPDTNDVVKLIKAAISTSIDHIQKNMVPNALSEDKLNLEKHLEQIVKLHADIEAAEQKAAAEQKPAEQKADNSAAAASPSNVQEKGT